MLAPRVLAAILALSAIQVMAQNAGKYPKTVELSYESLHASSSSNSPLATINYDPKTLDYVLSSWTPPSLDQLKSASRDPQSAPLVRVLSGNGGATVASLETFDTSLSQDIDVWISQATGEVISAAVKSKTPPPLSKEEELQRQKEDRLRKRGKEVPTSKPQKKPKSKKAKEVVVGETQAGPVVKVNLIIAGSGPRPKLNSRSPPQVDAEGREVAQEEPQEKTFIQKYWFVMLAIAFVAMSSGGGGKE